MATIIINGNEHTLPEHEKLNAIQAAQRFGYDIPYYCWHPSLSVVANCRMCEIEVGSKDPKTGEVKMVPKMVPGCQTPAKDMTVLVTDSEKVKAHQRMVMELPAHQPPARLPRVRPGGPVRAPGLQLRIRPGERIGSSRNASSTPARTCRTRSSSIKTAASCALGASGSRGRSRRPASWK